MIFVTADTHGESERFEDKQLKKLKKGDTLFILGDFGFVWKGDDKEKKALAKLAKKPFTTLFVDGLGDSFEQLDSYPDAVFCGAAAKEIARDKIYYIKRGEIAEIEGRKLLCFGGNDIYELCLLTEISMLSVSRSSQQIQCLSPAIKCWQQCLYSTASVLVYVYIQC